MYWEERSPHRSNGQGTDPELTLNLHCWTDSEEAHGLYVKEQRGEDQEVSMGDKEAGMGTDHVEPSRPLQEP